MENYAKRIEILELEILALNEKLSALEQTGNHASKYEYYYTKIRKLELGQTATFKMPDENGADRLSSSICNQYDKLFAGMKLSTNKRGQYVVVLRYE